MKQSGKVALGGMLGALSLTFMLLTFFPYATYALPALAGAIIIPFVVETNARSGWMLFAALAILAMIVSPDMQAKVLFIGFFGYYPVLKAQLEKGAKRWLEWVLKFLVFNVSMIVCYSLMLFVFHLDPKSFEVAGVNVAWGLLLAGNAVFLLYDYAMTNVISLYIRKFHPMIQRLFRLR